MEHKGTLWSFGVRRTTSYGKLSCDSRGARMTFLQMFRFTRTFLMGYVDGKQCVDGVLQKRLKLSPGCINDK